VVGKRVIHLQLDTVEKSVQICAGAGPSDVHIQTGPSAMMAARGMLADGGLNARAVRAMSASRGLVKAGS
jgi:hypothetical protein